MDILWVYKRSKNPYPHGSEANTQTFDHSSSAKYTLDKAASSRLTVTSVGMAPQTETFYYISPVNIWITLSSNADTVAANVMMAYTQKNSVSMNIVVPTGVQVRRHTSS